MPQITEQSLQNLSVQELQDLKRQMLEHNKKLESSQRPSIMSRLGRGALAGLKEIPYAVRGEMSPQPQQTELSPYEKQRQIEAAKLETRPSLSNVPEGYKLGYDKSGKQILEKSKELTLSRSDRFDKSLSEAISGQRGWEDVETEFPSQIDKIKSIKIQHTPIEKSPEFKEGRGLEAFTSPNVANLTSETKRVISNIKTEADFNELIENKDEYKANGVDIDAILEYFGRR